MVSAAGRWPCQLVVWLVFFLLAILAIDIIRGAPMRAAGTLPWLTRTPADDHSRRTSHADPCHSRHAETTRVLVVLWFACCACLPEAPPQTVPGDRTSGSTRLATTAFWRSRGKSTMGRPISSSTAAFSTGGRGSRRSCSRATQRWHRSHDERGNSGRPSAAGDPNKPDHCSKHRREHHTAVLD